MASAFVILMCRAVCWQFADVDSVSYHHLHMDGNSTRWPYMAGIYLHLHKCGAAALPVPCITDSKALTAI